MRYADALMWTYVVGVSAAVISLIVVGAVRDERFRDLVFVILVGAAAAVLFLGLLALLAVPVWLIVGATP